ncbi:hypothetical protein B1201_05630 [Acinetobacter sp. ANC 5600]|nr:hypothetical protein B1201_05630 [Acinetobacter sp. ANC 5600]
MGFNLSSLIFCYAYKVRNEGNLISAYASPITTLGVAIIFALRLTKSVRRIEKFNGTLATLVTQANESKYTFYTIIISWKWKILACKSVFKQHMTYMMAQLDHCD